MSFVQKPILTACETCITAYHVYQEAEEVILFSLDDDNDTGEKDRSQIPSFPSVETVIRLMLRKVRELTHVVLRGIFTSWRGGEDHILCLGFVGN